MSAAIVPVLYNAIVDEVVEQSRQDFQEDGINEATLQEFKSRWLEKIAATGATAMPSAQKTEDVEADAESAIDNIPAAFPQGGNALAAMRAAQQIQQLQARGGIQQHQADTAVAQLMKEAQQAQQSNEAQNGGSSNQIKSEPQDRALPPATAATNGKKRSLSLKSENDRPASKGKRRDVRTDADLDDEAINSDLDDSDDDALHEGGNEDVDGDMQTVLCTFDKVQRTKNKWKCVLKDGIVSVNGRDFAFNKANGEFEW